jgi:hypothetical protein
MNRERCLAGSCHNRIGTAAGPWRARGQHVRSAMPPGPPICTTWVAASVERMSGQSPVRRRRGPNLLRLGRLRCPLVLRATRRAGPLDLVPATSGRPLGPGVHRRSCPPRRRMARSMAISLRGRPPRKLRVAQAREPQTARHGCRDGECGGSEAGLQPGSRRRSRDLVSASRTAVTALVRTLVAVCEATFG